METDAKRRRVRDASSGGWGINFAASVKPNKKAIASVPGAAPAARNRLAHTIAFLFRDCLFKGYYPWFRGLVFVLGKFVWQ